MKDYDKLKASLYECEFPAMTLPVTRKDIFKAKLTGKPIMLDVRTYTAEERTALEDLLWHYGAFTPVEDYHGWYAEANVTVNMKIASGQYATSNWWQRMRGKKTKITRDEYYKRLAEINK